MLRGEYTRELHQDDDSQNTVMMMIRRAETEFIPAIVAEGCDISDGRFVRAFQKSIWGVKGNEYLFNTSSIDC